MKNIENVKRIVAPIVLGMATSFLISECTKRWKKSRANLQPDLKFIKNVIKNGVSMVEFGELALKQSSSGPVKTFAKKMVSDHQEINDQLIEIVEDKNFDESSLNKLSASAKRDYEKISEVSDAEFDKLFLKWVEKEHSKIIDVIESQTNISRNAALKNWAGESLTVLKKHLEHGQSLLEKLN